MESSSNNSKLEKLGKLDLTHLARKLNLSLIENRPSTDPKTWVGLADDKRVYMCGDGGFDVYEKHKNRMFGMGKYIGHIPDLEQNYDFVKPLI